MKLYESETVELKEIYTSDKKMTDGDSFESNRSLIQDLTFHRMREEVQKRGLEFTEVQMKNLGILSSDEIYTNLGLLVSDQCRHSIKFAIFQGTDKLVFRDRKEFTGSLFTQLTDAYKTIDFYNGTKATFHDLLRTDERDYPEDAVREALLNAIVHRDYSFSGSTLINLYSDRLEIVSLGGLVSGLSLEAVMLGAFQVVLPNIHAQKLNEEHEKYLPVIRLLEEQNEITRSEAERALGSGTTHAINMLKEMQEKGIVKKIGNGRMTRYVMK